MADVRYQYRGIGLDKIADPMGWLRNYVQTRLPLALAQKKAAMDADLSKMPVDDLLKFLSDLEKNRTDFGKQSLYLQGVNASNTSRDYQTAANSQAKIHAANMGVRREQIKQDAMQARQNNEQNFAVTTARYTTPGDETTVKAATNAAAQTYKEVFERTGDVNAAAASASQIVHDHLAAAFAQSAKRSPIHEDAVTHAAKTALQQAIRYNDIADPNAKIAFNDRWRDGVYDQFGTPYKIVDPTTGEDSVDAALQDDDYMQSLERNANPGYKSGGAGPAGPLATVTTTPGASTPHPTVLGHGADYFDVADRDGKYAYRIQIVPPKDGASDTEIKSISVIRDPTNPSVSPENPAHPANPAAEHAIYVQATQALHPQGATTATGDNARTETLPNGSERTTRDLAGQVAPTYGTIFDSNEDTATLVRQVIKDKLAGKDASKKVDHNDVGVRLFAPSRHPDQDLIDRIASQAQANPGDMAARLKAVDDFLASKVAGTPAPASTGAKEVPATFDKAWTQLESSITGEKMEGTPAAQAKRAELIAKQKAELAGMSTADQEHVLATMSYADRLAARPAPAQPGSTTEFNAALGDPWGARVTQGPPQPSPFDEPKTPSPRFARPVAAPGAVTPELRQSDKESFDAAEKDPWGQRFGTPTTTTPAAEKPGAKPPAFTPEDRESFRQRARDKGIVDPAKLDAVTAKWEAAQESANAAQ